MKMPYNKNNKEKMNKLTPKREEFCEQIMMGKSQYEAYITAYPKAKKWKRNSVDVQASLLMDDEKIKARLKELGYRDAKKVQWTRNKALETINKVMELHQQDMERIEKAYQEDLDRKDLELEQWVGLLTTPNLDDVSEKRIKSHINQLLDEMSDLRKIRRVNAVNTRGIYEGAKILNRMFGYDITKVEINQEDEERDEMEKLTVDELKELINISKKGE